MEVAIYKEQGPVDGNLLTDTISAESQIKSTSTTNTSTEMNCLRLIDK